jgi:hypothetical protein
MNHFATPDFWYLYRRLPTEVRLLADKNFALLRTDHNHPRSGSAGPHVRVTRPLSGFWQRWSFASLFRVR